jgi:hypothetical protein
MLSRLSRIYLRVVANVSKFAEAGFVRSSEWGFGGSLPLKRLLTEGQFTLFKKNGVPCHSRRNQK